MKLVKITDGARNGIVPLALSVRQPWAWLIIMGEKSTENRTWSTRYRGPLIIHASRTPSPDYRLVQIQVQQTHGIVIPEFEELAAGALVGIVNLVACGNNSNSRWWQGIGFSAWELEAAMPFDPIPYRGKQGLFSLTDYRLDFAA